MDGTGTLKSLDGLYTVSGQWRNGHPVDVIAEADPPVVREVLPTDTLLTVGKEPDVDLFALQKLLVFPEEARINDIDGKIRVRVLVTSTTQIAQVKVSEASHPIFVLPAIDAIFRSDFVRSPARLDDGKAVPIWLTVPIQFNFR